jgi:RNA polymerase sigma-70 factor (ECF subfamily)
MSQAGTPELARFPHVDLLRPLRCDRFAEDEDAAPERAPAAPQARAFTGPDTPARALAGEIELLYRRHNRLVFHLALRYGGGNTAWADDVTQDVFLDLWKALPTLVDRGSMEGWLYRATTNRCFTQLRRERFLKLAPVRWLLGEQKPEPRLPDALTIARDDLRRAMAALDALPLKERVAFSMYYLDEQEQEEIGRVLGHSKGYVCKLIQRAVARLREAGWEVDHASAR